MSFNKSTTNKRPLDAPSSPTYTLKLENSEGKGYVNLFKTTGVDGRTMYSGRPSYIDDDTGSWKTGDEKFFAFPESKTGNLKIRCQPNKEEKKFVDVGVVHPSTKIPGTFIGDGTDVNGSSVRLTVGPWESKQQRQERIARGTTDTTEG
jgi:hypothetical protein